MKYHSTCLLLFAAVALALTSCESPSTAARVGALTELAISYAARQGQIRPEDVADIRAAKAIILPPAAPSAGGKQPQAHLQP